MVADLSDETPVTNNIDRFQERLLSGDPEAVQELTDTISAFGAAWFESLNDAANAIAESALAEALKETLHAD